MKLPSPAVMRDFLLDQGLIQEDVGECIDTFIANAKFLGMLKTVAGAERLLTLDHALDEVPKEYTPTRLAVDKQPETSAAGAASPGIRSVADWDTMCFYITPIGDPESEERKHADLMVGAFIEPAMEPLKLKVVRADQIGEPGMIATQVLQHLRHARLAIADLSYLNPNVFYEVALRHARKLPVVQIMRKKDKLPFDIGQVRTVILDTTDIFALVPKIEIHRSEITTQSRAALEDPENIGNPVSVFYPKFYD